MNRHSNRHTPRRKCKMRSKFWWLTGFRNSHDVSHFAAFFIVVGAKTSVAESVFSFMDWYVGSFFGRRRNVRVLYVWVVFITFRCFKSFLGFQINGIKCGEWGQQVTQKLLFGGYTERKRKDGVLTPHLSLLGVLKDVVMILPQVHLRKPCYDFTFL